jgi:hypothetical protein
MLMPKRNHHTDNLEIKKPVGRSEGHAIIGANGLRQPPFPEKPLKGQESGLFLIAFHGLAQQQVARGVIGNRERVAVALVAELELSLVVGTPQVIGAQAWRKLCSLSPCSGSARPGDQTMPVQDRVNGTAGWHLHFRRQAPK